MHEYSASLMQSEDDMCMYFDAAEDQNVDDSNQESASPTREVQAGMPEEYYHGLESFLSQAPPALDMFNSQSTSAATSTAAAVHHSSKQQRRNSGSKNKVTLQAQLRQHQWHPAHHQSGARNRQRQPASGRGSSEFDFDLLQQAMQYTARLALEDRSNEQPDSDGPPPPPPQQQQHQQQRRHSRGGKQKPPLRRNSSSRSAIVVREKSSGVQLRSLPPAHAKKRLPRRMREAVSSRQDEGQLHREASWSAPSAADTRPLEADNCLDVESLVENFEKGLALEQLRQELAASQSSMNHSHDILAKAAAEFFAQHGRSF